MPADRTSPYLLDEPPTSTGKALLARAFWHWCALHHGLSPEEIAEVFSDGNAVDAVAASEVRHAVRLLGELFAAGDVLTFARPFGGGDPERLPASAWELDDFRSRFAQSAIDPNAPFSPDAVPTHWIFVDLKGFNQVVEASCTDLTLPRAEPTAEVRRVDGTPIEPIAIATEDRHVRMPELERRTGMSRSTIYRRIEKGRFPQSIPMDGNISAWREHEVAEWLANPR